MNTASFHQPITTELTVLCHALFIDIFATTGQNKLLQNFHLWLVHFFLLEKRKNAWHDHPDIMIRVLSHSIKVGIFMFNAL